MDLAPTTITTTDDQQTGHTLLESLQLRYTELCAEKRRLLKELETTRKDTKQIQTEIHRLLDIAAEWIPVSDFADEWSTSENDELFSCLQEADTDLARTRAALTELCGAGEGRRRSLSPSKGGKMRRSYKYLPTNAEGVVEFPLVLGRAINRLTLLNIGEPKAAPEFTNGPYVYPPGFETRRKYRDPKQSDRKIYFTCRVEERDGKAWFVIAPNPLTPTEPAPEEFAESDLGRLWQDFVGKYGPYASEVQDDFASGESFFGFDHESVRNHIQELLGLQTEADKSHAEDDQKNEHVEIVGDVVG